MSFPALRGSERYEACGDDVRRGPFRAKRARFPLVPPFRDASCGGAIHRPPYLKAVACRFGALRAASLLPVQSYPPKLVSSFNSITFLNAAQNLCALFNLCLSEPFAQKKQTPSSGARLAVLRGWGLSTYYAAFVEAQRRLDRRQMCIFSAAAMSSSRKSGWATEMIPSARCQADRPFRFTMPYSVTR